MAKFIHSLVSIKEKVKIKDEKKGFPCPILHAHDACWTSSSDSIYRGNWGQKSLISGNTMKCCKFLSELLSVNGLNLSFCTKKRCCRSGCWPLSRTRAIWNPRRLGQLSSPCAWARKTDVPHSGGLHLASSLCLCCLRNPQPHLITSFHPPSPYSLPSVHIGEPDSRK